MQTNEQQFFEHLMNNYTPTQVINLIKVYAYVNSKEKVIEFLKRITIEHPDLINWLKSHIDINDKSNEYNRQKFDIQAYNAANRLAYAQYNELAPRFGFPSYEYKD